MKKYSISLRRVVSFIMALFIAFTGTPAFSASSNNPIFSAHSSPGYLSDLSAETFQVSNKLGRLESFHPGTGPLIVHIQTAHGHYEAQKKIEAILKELEAKQGITTILVEGSWSKLYPEILNFFPENQKQTNKLNDLLAHQAIVQGPELYLLNSKKAQGFGIEDKDAYLRNAADFAAVIKAREESRKFLTAAMDGVEKIASAYLNRNLRDFLNREEGFRNGVVSLPDWLQELKRQVQINYEEDLSDIGFQSEWPMLVRYFTIQQKEKMLDAVKLEKEKERFLDEIESRMVSRPEFQGQRLYHDLDELLNIKGASAGMQREAVKDIFIRMMRVLPENFNYDQYPSIKAMLGVLLLQSEIDAKLLMQEMEKLEKLLLDKMTGSEAERKIVNIYQRKILLSKLLNLELTPHEYGLISGQRSEISDQIKSTEQGAWSVERFKPSTLISEIKSLNGENRVRGIHFEGLTELDAVYEKALRFYSGAQKRDKHMIENIERVIDSLGVNKVAVITGGFHAEPFRDYFQERRYSYGLVMPSISHADEKGRESYLSLMQEQLTLQTKAATIASFSTAALEGLPSLGMSLSRLGKVGLSAWRNVSDWVSRQFSLPTHSSSSLRRLGGLGFGTLASLAIPSWATAQQPGPVLTASTSPSPAKSSSIVAVNKKTREQISFVGVNTEDALFQLFVRGGNTGEAAKLKADKNSAEFYKKPIEDIKLELSKRALAKILYYDPLAKDVISPGSVQYVRVLFDLLFKGIGSAGLTEKEFKNIKKLALIGLTAILYNYKFSENGINYFLFGSGVPGQFDGLNGKAGEPIYKDIFFKPYVLGLISEMAAQLDPKSPHFGKLEANLLAYQRWIDEGIKTQLKDEMGVRVTEEEQISLKVWYVDAFAVLMNTPDFLTPLKEIPAVTDGGMKTIISKNKSLELFAEMIPGTKIREAVRSALWKLLNDRDLLSQATKQVTPVAKNGGGSRNYYPFFHMLEALSKVINAANLAEFETYVMAPQDPEKDLPKEIKEYARKRIKLMKEMMTRSELRGLGFGLLAAPFRAVMGRKSLIAQGDDAMALPLPSSVKRLGSVAFIFAPDEKNAEAKIAIAQKFSNLPVLSAENFKQLLPWARYMSEHHGLVWSLQVTQSQEAGGLAFRLRFLELAARHGLQISSKQILLERVPDELFNLAKLSKLDLAVVAPDAVVLSRLNVSVKGRVILKSTKGMSAFSAGLIATAETLLDPRGFPQKAVDASELRPFTFDYEQILAAVIAFSQSA